MKIQQFLENTFFCSQKYNPLPGSHRRKDWWVEENLRLHRKCYISIQRSIIRK